MGTLDYPNRIRFLLKELSLTQAGLAAKLGVTQGIISEFTSGSREPSKDFMLGISGLGVSLDWFLTGEGHPFIGQAQPETLGHAPSGATLAKTELVVHHTNGQPPKPAKYKIPLLRQKVSCGPGVEWNSEDNIEQYLTIDIIIPHLGIGRVIAVKASGSSMLGADIKNGDILIVTSKQDLEPVDGIYAFAFDGEVYCKRLEFDKLSRKIHIFSMRQPTLDKAELVETIDTTDASYTDRFFVYGRVVQIVRTIYSEE